MARSSVPLVLLLLLVALDPPRTAAGQFETPAMTPDELHDRQAGEAPLLVLDVRDPAEYRVGHVPGAFNLPAAEIPDQLSAIEGQDGVVLYCIAGSRTQTAEQVLLKHGFGNVFHLEDGLTGWLDSGYPVEKGEGPALAKLQAGRH